MTAAAGAATREGVTRRVVAVAAVAGLILAMLVPAPAAAATENFADSFKKISYGGNDGSLRWTGKWAETPLQGNPKQGNFRVVNSGKCAGNNCLRIGGAAVVLSFQGILREADLSGASSATFRFSYRRQLNGLAGGGVTANVTANGFIWDELTAMPLTTSDGSHKTVSFDITPWIDADTQIAFFGYDLVDGYVFIDDVEIEAEFGSPPVLDTDLGDRTDDEDDVVSFFAAGSDPDGGAVTYSATGLPPGVSIDPGSGEIAGRIGFDGAAGSPYATRVTVTDDSGAGVVDAFTWTVRDVNRKPTLAKPADVVMDEQTAMTVQLSASDPDLEYGDALTYSLDRVPAGAEVDPATGVITWTPGEADGPDTVTIKATVTDGAGESDTKAFDVTVREVNRPPVLSSPGDQVNGVGDSVSLQLQATDPDVPQNELTFSASGLPKGLTINQSTGRITGTISSSAANELPHIVTLAVTDDGSPELGDEVVISWLVTRLNRAPRLDPIPPQSPDASGLVAFQASASDPDGDDLTFSLVAGADAVPAGAAITASGRFTWTPTDAQRDAEYRFFVKVSDDGLPTLSAKQEVVVTVPGVNHPPVLADPGNQSDDEGAGVDLVVTATDPDLPEDALRFSATGLPPGLTMSRTGSVSGVVSYDAAAGSPYTVTITVTDSGSPALSDSATITWSVANVNRPPTIEDASAAVSTGASVQVAVTASDPDGDPLTFTVEPPAHGTITGAGPTFTYRPAVTTDAVEVLTVTVSDGSAEAQATLTIDVKASNAAPVAVGDAYTVDAGAVLHVAAPGVLGNDRDADDDTLTAELVEGTRFGDVELAPDGSFTYTPVPGFAGEDSFTYAVGDGITRDIATVAIDVAPGTGGPGDDETDPGSEVGREDVVDATAVSLDPNDPDDPAGEETPERAITRTFVTIGRAGIQQIPSMGFPLLLLLVTLAVALTIGRISTVPLLGGTREAVGWVKVYDPVDGFGLIRRTDGPDVLVEASSVDTTLGRLRVGQRVRFKMIDGGDRSYATKVWLD